VAQFMAQSYLHVVIKFLRPTEHDQICDICSLVTGQYQILQHSVEMGKFCGLAQNSAFHRKLWSLPINPSVICLYTLYTLYYVNIYTVTLTGVECIQWHIILEVICYWLIILSDILYYILIMFI